MKSDSVVAAVIGAFLRIVMTVVIVFLLYRGAMICYDYGYRIFTEPAVSAGAGRTVSVTIPKGMSASEMGALFAEKGLIKDEKLFVLQYYLSEFRTNIRSGTFQLSTAMTVEEMMEVMATPAEKDEGEG